MFPGGWGNEGLITYGTSINDAVPRIPEYVDRILKGAKPGELPIAVEARPEFIVNLGTAREIGISVPSELTRRATRLVQ